MESFRFQTTPGFLIKGCKNISGDRTANGRPLTPPGSYKDVGPTIFESQWVGT